MIKLLKKIFCEGVLMKQSRKLWINNMLLDFIKTTVMLEVYASTSIKVHM